MTKKPGTITRKKYRLSFDPPIPSVKKKCWSNKSDEVQVNIYLCRDNFIIQGSFPNIYLDNLFVNSGI